MLCDLTVVVTDKRLFINREDHKIRKSRLRGWKCREGKNAINNRSCPWKILFKRVTDLRWQLDNYSVVKNSATAGHRKRAWKRAWVIALVYLVCPKTVVWPNMMNRKWTTEKTNAKEKLSSVKFIIRCGTTLCEEELHNFPSLSLAGYGSGLVDSDKFHILIFSHLNKQGSPLLLTDWLGDDMAILP